MIATIMDFVKSAVSEQILKDPVWASIAIVGQLFFAGRFLLQWIASELRKQSYIPLAFWYISLIGSLILFVYSLHIKNPIFMLGFSLNMLIYIRNLYLIYRQTNRKDMAVTGNVRD